MLRILIVGSACVLSTALLAQNVGISVHGAVPNANAMLDIDVSGLGASDKRGLLIPRMTEAQRIAIAPGTAENALLVYQTDLGAAQDSLNAIGFWYWDEPATQWVHLGHSRGAWNLAGNSPITVTTGNAEFLGTLQQIAGYAPNRKLIFRTGPTPMTGAPAMQFGYAVQDFQSGFLGLGTPAEATERLEVQGAIRMGQSDQITPPRIGTIRYGTRDGAASTGTNLNYHWGTLDTVGNIYWARLENAETRVTPPQSYAKDTMACLNNIGDAFRGDLSPEPVTMPVHPTPANIYSPFATNYSSNNEGNYRVQYLYKYSELVEAGLCFPASITAVSFFCLDQETMLNTVPPASSVGPTVLAGEVRGGAATIAGLNSPNPYFGGNNVPPYMDPNVRSKAIPDGTFSLMNPTPGWMTFNLTHPITLNVNQNLILDIVWSRNKADGVGPRVELEDPGFNCVKWVIWPNSLGNIANRNSLTDNSGSPPGSPAPIGAINAPTNLNPHSKRPVTRFTGKVRTPSVVQAYSNYLLYDGGIMVGDPTWAATAGNFKGPGTVKAQNGVYDGTLLLSDHVFDRYFDGIRPESEDGTMGYAYTGLAQLRDRLERERRLPNMPSREQWEASGGASMGRLATGLWETVEDQALYITQLEKDLSALELLSFGDNLTEEEGQKLIGEITASRRLTEAQKIHLVEAVRSKLNTQNRNGQ